MIKLNKEITIKVNNNECSSDAIDRYMKRKGLKKNIHVIVDGCKTVSYIDEIEDHKYFIGSYETSLDGSKVTFTIILDY